MRKNLNFALNFLFTQQTMKKLTLCLLALMAALCVDAKELTLADFNSDAVGTAYPMQNLYGETQSTTKAVVSVSPTDKTQNVLHVTTKEWNTFAKFELPEELYGDKLLDSYQYIEFDVYRVQPSSNDYFQLPVVMVGETNQTLYWDEGYPYQDNKSKWQHRRIAISSTEPLTGNAIVLGIHGDNVEYYLDNVKLTGTDRMVIDNGEKVTFSKDDENLNIYLKNGSIWSESVSLKKPFGSNVTVDKGEMHFAFNNTSSTYADISVPIKLNDGAVLSVYTSRYTYWMSAVSGNGTVNLYGGGERTFAGNAKNAAFPNWANFTGKLNIYPYKDIIGSCGFYGLVLNDNKTFYPDDVEGGLKDGKYNNMFEHATLNITKGATLANENGNRAFRIAHLDMEEGSVLKGYYKGSSAKSFYIVGGDNTNSTLYGNFTPESGNALGLIKEGKGVYTIASKQNSITGGVRVMDGTVYVDGTTGAALSGAVVTVCPNGLVGGVGNIGGIVDVYGSLRPGNDAIGKLAIAKKLIVRPTAKLLFRIGSEANDELAVTDSIKYDSKCFDFTTSDKKPIIKPIIDEDLTYTAGAEYVLVKAKASDCSFRIANPNTKEWNVIEKMEDGVYTVILKAEPSTNPNDIDYNADDNIDNDDEVEYNLADFDFSGKSTRTKLRDLADKAGKKIGVAVPVYKLDIGNTSDSRTVAIYNNFNICVCENEMKIDALQPNQGQFEWYNADLLVNLAQSKNMRMRGHTLVWHQQVPGWISSDGKKNDKNWTRQEALDIMKTHITTVMKHFKGKVYEWDVVNEMLDDDQSIVRTNPNGYTLRSNVWYKAIGEDYIDSALVYAHRADPEAKLYINEYGAEMMGNAKAEAYYNLAKRLLKSNIPLDGVGLQCHFSVGELKESKFDANVARYADININCIVTELDMSIKDYSDPDCYKRQALEYYKIVKTMLKYDHFPHLIIWGVTDDLSWRSGEPLLFDKNVTKKQAFWAVYDLVAKAAATSVHTESLSPTISSREGGAYNLAGQKVGEDYKGIVIVDGKKVLNK